MFFKAPKKMSFELKAIFRKKDSVIKKFESHEQASKYMEKLLTANKLQIENVITKNGTKEYICNLYNRFILTPIELA